VVELTSFSRSTPFPDDDERYLEEALLGRAEANEALLVRRQSHRPRPTGQPASIRTG